MHFKLLRYCVLPGVYVFSPVIRPILKLSIGLLGCSWHHSSITQGSVWPMSRPEWYAPKVYNYVQSLTRCKNRCQVLRRAGKGRLIAWNGLGDNGDQLSNAVFPWFSLNFTINFRINPQLTACKIQVVGLPFPISSWNSYFSCSTTWAHLAKFTLNFWRRKSSERICECSATMLVDLKIVLCLYIPCYHNSYKRCSSFQDC